MKINMSWLNLSSYEFKILIMIANSAPAFTGNLRQMCDYLEITNNTINTERVKDALYYLTEKKFIKASVDGFYWTLALRPQETPEVEITEEEVQKIREYRGNCANESSAWSTMVKVLAHSRAQAPVKETQAETAAQLGVSARSVSRARHALKEIGLA